MAVLFIFFIILILWEIKADFVLIIFGFAAYLFLIFFIGSSDPLGNIVSIVDFLIFNPLGLLFLIIPSGIFCVYKYFKKNKNNI